MKNEEFVTKEILPVVEDNLKKEDTTLYYVFYSKGMLVGLNKYSLQNWCRSKIQEYVSKCDKKIESMFAGELKEGKTIKQFVDMNKDKPIGQTIEQLKALIEKDEDKNRICMFSIGMISYLYADKVYKKEAVEYYKFIEECEKISSEYIKERQK